MKNRNMYLKYGLGVGFAVSAGLSHAAIDVSGVTSAIGEAGVAAAAVGAATLVMIVGIKVYKWIRGAM